MKKQLIAFATLLSASSLAFAVQPGGGTGIGISQGNSADVDETRIHVPFVVGNQGLWLEPFLAYHDNETDVAGGTNEIDTWTFGVGIFQDLNVTEKTRFYGGARVGYFEAEIDTPAGTTTDLDGWLIEPTLGFGYAPVDNILVGAEAFVSYSEADDDATGGDTDSLDTGTALFARYFFDIR